MNHVMFIDSPYGITYIQNINRKTKDLWTVTYKSYDADICPVCGFPDKLAYHHTYCEPETLTTKEVWGRISQFKDLAASCGMASHGIMQIVIDGQVVFERKGTSETKGEKP